jgi:preprotein translocase subunit YajC
VSGLLILMVLVFVVFYVLAVRPQRKRQAQHQATVDRLGVGEDVLTTGGIYGTVTQSDGDDLVVEIAEGVEVHMTRRGIAAVLPPEDEEGDVAEEDEAAVTAGEETVTDDTGDRSWTGHRS